LDGPKDCFAVSDIEAGVVEGPQIVAFQGLLEVPTQLAPGAGQQDPHYVGIASVGRPR
jgi:hypothetical protein